MNEVTMLIIGLILGGIILYLVYSGFMNGGSKRSCMADRCACACQRCAM